MRVQIPLDAGAGADQPSSSNSPGGPHSFLNGGGGSSGAGGAAAGRGQPPETLMRTRTATLIFFKGLFGAGLLALPGAFGSVGLPLALLVFGIVSTICLGTMLMLLDCRRLVREETGVWVDSYEQLAGEVFGLRAYWVTQGVMSVLTLIYCSGFVIVVSSSLAAVLPLSRAFITLLIFPILILLSWLPFMKDLWVVSIFGLVVYLLGIVGATVWYSATHYQPSENTMEWRWRGLPHFFGVAVYALEGINLTLPISASMKSIKKPPMVMTVGVVGFAGIVAFYSAYAYASGVGAGCDIITDCLAEGVVVDTVRVALALSLIATHPVYLIVASEIFERALILGPDAEERAVRQRIDADFHHLHAAAPHDAVGSAADPAPAAAASHHNHTEASVNRQQELEQQRQERPCLAGGPLSDMHKRRLLRTAECALTCLVGGSVQSLGAFTSLVGATLVTFIGFLLPTAMWVELQRHSHRSHAERLRTYGIAAVIISAGLVAMVVGTVEGIRGLAGHGHEAKG